MRERGLKFAATSGIGGSVSRSREGAWIEIFSLSLQGSYMISRSREGAWIEIPCPDYRLLGMSVAPVRERGLKCNKLMLLSKSVRSLP